MLSSRAWNKNENENMLQVDFLNATKIGTPSRIKYRLNLFDNTFSPELNRVTREEEKLREFIQQDEKDKEKYFRIKDKMKSKFFKIRHNQGNKLKNPILPLPLSHLQKFSQLAKSPPTSQIPSSNRAYQLSNKQQIASQIDKVLEASLSLAFNLSKPKSKIRTKSQLDRKHRNEVKQQKDLIMKFIKKSSSVEMGEKKWEDLTNNEKYMMNFTDYVKKKTKSAIERDVFEKIQKKTSKMEKFQDFILEEVKFSADHKEKLTHFFKQVRFEFKRAQNHQRSKSMEFKKQELKSKLQKK